MPGGTCRFFAHHPTIRAPIAAHWGASHDRFHSLGAAEYRLGALSFVHCDHQSADLAELGRPGGAGPLHLLRWIGRILLRGVHAVPCSDGAWHVLEARNPVVVRARARGIRQRHRPPGRLGGPFDGSPAGDDRLPAADLPRGGNSAWPTWHGLYPGSELVGRGVEAL